MDIKINRYPKEFAPVTLKECGSKKRGSVVNVVKHIFIQKNINVKEDDNNEEGYKCPYLFNPKNVVDYEKKKDEEIYFTNIWIGE